MAAGLFAGTCAGASLCVSVVPSALCDVAFIAALSCAFVLVDSLVVVATVSIAVPSAPPSDAARATVGFPNIANAKTSASVLTTTVRLPEPFIPFLISSSLISSPQVDILYARATLPPQPHFGVTMLP